MCAVFPLRSLRFVFLFVHDHSGWFARPVILVVTHLRRLGSVPAALFRKG